MDRKSTKLAIALVLLLISMLTTGLLGACSQTNDQPKTHTPTPGQERNFTLYVRDNLLKMPNGQQIYVFGYTDDPHGRAQVPGPPLIVDEGDTVNVTIVNDGAYLGGMTTMITVNKPDGSNPVPMPAMNTQ